MVMLGVLYTGWKHYAQKFFNAQGRDQTFGKEESLLTWQSGCLQILVESALEQSRLYKKGTVKEQQAIHT